MNQDFTEKKKHYLFEKKILAEGFTWKKNRAQVVSKKKKFRTTRKFPSPPITFLMVRPLSDSLRIYFFPLWPRPHGIGFVADIFFSTLESGFIFFRIRCRIRRIRVDGSRIRREKVANSKISGYVWTGPQWAEQRLCTCIILLVHIFTSSSKQRRKMVKFCFERRTWTTTDKF